MSLKGKLAAFAAKKITEKVVSSNVVNNAVNSTFAKIGKYTGQKTVVDHIQEIEENCLIIKAKSYSLGTMIGALHDKIPNDKDYLGRYQIVDTFGEIKYKAIEENSFIDRKIIYLFNANDQKIGSLKESILTMGVPVFEKDVKRCSIYLKEEEIAELKKSSYFGNLELEISEENIEITYKKEEEFKVYYKGILIAEFYDVPLILKDGYREKYVMKYDNAENEVLAILLMMAIDFLYA